MKISTSVQQRPVIVIKANKTEIAIDAKKFQAVMSTPYNLHGGSFVAVDVEDINGQQMTAYVMEHNSRFSYVDSVKNPGKDLTLLNSDAFALLKRAGLEKLPAPPSQKTTTARIGFREHLMLQLNNKEVTAIYNTNTNEFEVNSSPEINEDLIIAKFIREQVNPGKVTEPEHYSDTPESIPSWLHKKVLASIADLDSAPTIS
jgi:hypothetical protein